MDFEYFGLSRDLLYLCSLFLGTIAAAFIVMKRKECTMQRKSLQITLILFLAACAIASLAASVILSQGLIFTFGLIYPFVVLFLVLGFLALYFPLAGGCTIIFAAGLFAVIIGVSFLIYPGFKEPSGIVVRSSGTELIFRRGDETWDVNNDRNIIRFVAVSITAYPAYPLIGGERRGLITRVLRNGTELFILSGNSGRFSGVNKNSLGFLRQELTLDLPLGTMPPGISLSVLFDGKKLYYDPPIQL